MEFIEPTIQGGPAKIRRDSEGYGDFMATRGKRLHRGIDLVGKPGMEIVSPIAGRFDRIYRPYAKDLQWRGAFIKGPHLWVGIFYITPYDNLLGAYLKAGQPLGYMQDISKKYGGDMKPHIHLETILPPLGAVDRNGTAFGGKQYINPLCFVTMKESK
jgi:murein DD-endopeptidase MepM/ murein hydrolase activator NlpD